MSTEVRVTRLEQRVDQLEVDRDGHTDKIDQVLQGVVDMHEEMRQLRNDLPDIIARAVAPLLARRED